MTWVQAATRHWSNRENHATIEVKNLVAKDEFFSYVGDFLVAISNPSSAFPGCSNCSSRCNWLPGQLVVDRETRVLYVYVQNANKDGRERKRSMKTWFGSSCWAQEPQGKMMISFCTGVGTACRLLQVLLQVSVLSCVTFTARILRLIISPFLLPVFFSMDVTCPVWSIYKAFVLYWKTSGPGCSKPINPRTRVTLVWPRKLPCALMSMRYYRLWTCFEQILYESRWEWFGR